MPKKGNKQRLRLQSRVEAWDKMGGVAGPRPHGRGGQMRMINKSCFTKPGSNKK